MSTNELAHLAIPELDPEAVGTPNPETVADLIANCQSHLAPRGADPRPLDRTTRKMLEAGLRYLLTQPPERRTSPGLAEEVRRASLRGGW